jgi:hypothetical protein
MIKYRTKTNAEGLNQFHVGTSLTVHGKELYARHTVWAASRAEAFAMVEGALGGEIEGPLQERYTVPNPSVGELEEIGAVAAAMVKDQLDSMGLQPVPQPRMRPRLRPGFTVPTCLNHHQPVARKNARLVHVNETDCDSIHVIYPDRACTYPVTMLMPLRRIVPVLHIRHPLLDFALCGAPAKQTLAEAIANSRTAAQMRDRGEDFTSCRDCCAVRDYLVRGTLRGDLDETL